jgi:shikimate dehydrogenase
MRLFGLIGYPLSHSFSEKYFTNKFEQEGIKDCRYDLFPMENIENLPKLLSQNKNIEGLNVTIPHKNSVLKYLDNTENIPAELAACNCIKIKNGILTGYNTDVTGFEKSITHFVKSVHKKALVLGNGGSASAVKFVLKKLGIDITIVSRQLQNDSTLTYHDLKKKIIGEHTLIINTTPLGMFPNIDQAPEIPYQFLGKKHFLFDLIYNPSKTLFLKMGEAKGAAIQNGYEMLVNQAEESWKIWNC